MVRAAVHWHSLPGDVVEAPSVKISSHLHLYRWLQVAFLELRVGPEDFQRSILAQLFSDSVVSDCKDCGHFSSSSE